MENSAAIAMNRLRRFTWGALVIAGIITLLALATTLLFRQGYIERDQARLIVYGSATVVLIVGAVGITYLRVQQDLIRTARIEEVEERVRANPEQPKLAWDLARTKLESYLDRNLSQVKSIYWLTLMVMLGGFLLIASGLYNAMQDVNKFPVSVVASASGVLVSLIGGSFLLIYRSILTQSKEYVTVLERINAVGMAVQVIGTIPDSEASLRNQTTAELARQLLNLYASNPGARRNAVSPDDQ